MIDLELFGPPLRILLLLEPRNILLSHIARATMLPKEQFQQALNYLVEKGVVEVVDSNGKIYVRLTPKGEYTKGVLEELLSQIS